MADPGGDLSDLTIPIERGFDAYALRSDSADLAISTRALYIGAGGNVKVTTTRGSELTFVGLVAGTVLPVRVARLWSTGTTATNVLGLY